MTTNYIAHGDCREVLFEMLERGTIQGKINAIITDPPFGIDYRSNRAVMPHGIKRNKVIKADKSIEAALRVFDEFLTMSIPAWAPDFELYIFTHWTVMGDWMNLLKDYEQHLDRKACIVWNKGYPGQGDLESPWGCGHEMILYYRRGRRPRTARRRTAVVAVDRVPSKMNIHPTEKPLNIIEPLIEASTSPGDWIMDPFSGSGATSVAAQAMGRNSIAMEDDEDYIEPSRKRLEQIGLF